MAQSSTCYSSCQNSYDGKDKLTGRISTKGNKPWTLASAAIHAPTPTAASIVALLAASGFADSSMVRYSEDEPQQIFRAVLDFRPLAPFPTLGVTTAPHSKKPRERLLKAWFPDIYWGKTHLEYYNFFQQCKDHFATAGAMGSSRVPFRLSC